MSHLTLFLQFSMYTGSPFPPSSSSTVLAFIEFLQSNGLSPPSISGYVHSLFHPSFATIVLKWSKTLQAASQYATVQIPVLGSSPLCPISSLKAMFQKFPLPPNAPLFAVPQGQGFIVLTQSKVRKTLSSILSSIGIDPSTHPFHTFRRSGASLAFHSDVSLQAIQHQGTWTSDAVWNYIISNPPASVLCINYIPKPTTPAVILGPWVVINK